MTISSKYSETSIPAAGEESAIFESAAPANGQDWMKAATVLDATIDANQLASLNGMISYLATLTGQTEYRIERDLSDRFKVPNVKYMLTSRFDEALHYLVDTIDA